MIYGERYRALMKVREAWEQSRIETTVLLGAKEEENNQH